MSVVLISAGDMVIKDPADIKLYAIDWDGRNLKPGVIIATSTWTITPIGPNWSRAKAYAVGDQVVVNGVLYTSVLASANQMPPNATYWVVTAIALTKDSETKLTASQATAALQGLRTVTVDDRMTQVRLLVGTLNHVYEIANKVVTNETPAQTKERSFRILIENQ